MQDMPDDGANGAVPTSARENIAAQLDALLIDTRYRRDALQAQVAEMSGEIKAYEQALARLRGDYAVTPGPKRKRTTSSPPVHGSGVGSDRLAKYEKQIREFARDHEEFRQIDFRTSPLSEGMSSSVASTVFEVLRQRNVLRLARREGNQKFYRLTAEALSETLSEL